MTLLWWLCIVGLFALLGYAAYRWQVWRLPRKGLLVLMYHHIRPAATAKDVFSIRPEVFGQQLALLQKKGFSFVTTDDIARARRGEKTLPQKSVLLTFDDGYADNATHLFPLLQKYNAHAVIFLVTDFIGQKKGYMSWDQARQLQQSGLVTFGSHTCSHARLRQLPDEQIRRELVDSKQKIEQELGVICNCFCYPFGSGGFDKRVRPLVLQAGYELDFSTKPGINPLPWTGKKTLLRTFPRGGESLFDFYVQITRGKSRF